MQNDNTLFLTSPASAITYRRLYQFAGYFSRQINQASENPVKKIILLLPESEISITVIAACWLLDITFIPLSTTWTQQEIRQRLAHTKYDLILVSDSRFPDFLSDKENIIPINSSWLEASAYENTEIDTATSKAGSLFAKIFTSGTTGAPKLVPLKKRQMVSAARASAENFELIPDECWLLCLPLHHIGGISIILRSLIYHSGIYFAYPFSAPEIAEHIKLNPNIKAMSLVPTMLKRLLDHSGFDLPNNFKAVLLGGGPADNSMIASACAANLPLFVSYGMTETCAQIAANRVENPDKAGALKIFPPNRVEIRGKHQQKRSATDTGLIWLKGPQVFDGYHNPPLNNRVFDKRGWFCTGDYGYLDHSGNLHIQHRRSDLIITGGENVYANEVELALTDLPFIKEAAVTGVPDAEWGEQIIAFVVKSSRYSDKQVTAGFIKKKLRSHLAAYKIPKKIFFLSHLPKTPLDKIQKNKLLETYKASI